MGDYEGAEPVRVGVLLRELLLVLEDGTADAGRGF